MPLRMQHYHAALVRRFGLPVRQFVLYFGRGPLRHLDRPLAEPLRYRDYQLIALHERPYEEALQAEAPEEVLLAVLSDFGTVPPPEALRRIVERLREISPDSPALRKYLNQLIVLAQHRKLEWAARQIVDAMPLDIDYRDHDLYQEGLKEGKLEGKEEGLKEGERKGKEEGAFENLKSNVQKMHLKGFSAPQIASLLDLSVEYVEALLQEQ
jgi:predicted transposase YdaD